MPTKISAQGRKRVRGLVNTMSITPLNMSLIDLFREVRQAERFPKSKALKTRASTNRSLFCKYHNGFGHRTEDCYDLQDAVEQLIREGRLAKNIASQRSPRKWRVSPSRDEPQNQKRIKKKMTRKNLNDMLTSMHDKINLIPLNNFLLKNFLTKLTIRLKGHILLIISIKFYINSKLLVNKRNVIWNRLIYFLYT